MTAPGDCFTKAIDAALVAAEMGADVLVVHGLPLGRGPENMDARYWHAWVEVKTPAGWQVVDVSNGLRVAMKRAQYYRIGRVDPERVWRYTLAEAMGHVDATRHAGPWVEGDDAMGLFAGGAR